jgi:anaerobic selenocysteine-containing dehydrogenase
VDQVLAKGLSEQDVDRWVQSACVLCSNGCGIDIAVKDGTMVGVRGRAMDIVNHGRLGPKGLFASWQGVSNKDRLTQPLIRENGELVETDWDTAMDRIVSRSKALLEEKGPLSHGFYTSGQLFLEEYYALGIIGKAGLGTPPHGRQHQAVHGHRSGGDEGVLRLGRSARQLHRHRRMRRHLPLRPQHGRDPDRAVGPGPGPDCRAQ